MESLSPLDVPIPNFLRFSCLTIHYPIEFLHFSELHWRARRSVSVAACFPTSSVGTRHVGKVFVWDAWRIREWRPLFVKILLGRYVRTYPSDSPRNSIYSPRGDERAVSGKPLALHCKFAGPVWCGSNKTPSIFAALPGLIF